MWCESRTATGGPELSSRLGPLEHCPTPLLVGAACAGLVLLAGCGSGQQKTRTLPSQTMSRVEPEAPELKEAGVVPLEEEAAEASDEAAGEVEEEVDDSVILIEAPHDPVAQPSLIEAARAERERRRDTEAPVHVITDKNLAEYATGELTVVEASGADEQGPPTIESGEPQQEGGAESEAGDEKQPEESEKKKGEDYWRNRALQIRLAWRDAELRIQELELRAAELRQRFYAEDDAYYRDSQIKPAWDRVIDQLEEAKRSVVARQEDLADLMEEGRRAGALPGWLREGIEFEPVPQEEEDDILEPGEPVVVQENGGRG